jgi:hypothetical protein
MIIKSIYMLVTYDGNSPLGRPRRRWEGNTKIDLREVGREGADWTDLVADRENRAIKF